MMAYRLKSRPACVLATCSHRKMLWLCLAALASFVSSFAANAQNADIPNNSASVVEARVQRRTVRVPVIEGTDIRFRRLSTEAGLSQTRVEQIVQDDQGFMWFGTQFGLNRYDGNAFKVFTPNPASTNSISGGYIYSLFKDRSNMLWIGCNQFVDRFDPTTERFTHYRLDSKDSDGVPVTVLSIAQDSSGTLWLGTVSGLYGLDSTTGRIIHHYTHDPRDSSTLNGNEIKPLIVDGRLLVADGNDLEQLDDKTGKVIWRFILPGATDIFSAVAPARAGTPRVSHPGIPLWTDYTKNWQDGGFALLDLDASELTYYSFYDQKSGKSLHLSVSAVVEEASGSFWLGGNGGLLRLDPETGRAIRYRHHVDDPESLGDDRVIALEQDREGNIWVGLHAREPNVFSTRKPPFTPILRESLARNPLGEYLVSAIYEDRRGTLWVGASGNLLRTDRKTGKYTSYPVNDDVISITGDSAGAIWVGTGYKGLYRFDPRTSYFKRFPLNPSPSAAYHNQILRIFIDRTGAMWLATRSGLQRFESTTGRFTVSKGDVRSGTDEYYDIVEDENGRLWLAGNRGLQRYDPATGEFAVYEHRLGDPKSLSDNTVSSVLVDHSDSVWAATYNGLAKLDQKSGTFTNYYATDGLPSSRVNCVLEDGHGALWLSTARGVSRFDPVAKTFKNYSIADGLPGLDLTGWVTSFKSPSGEMFFGGFSGATSFFPDNVVDSSYVPPIVFTDFLLSGHTVNIGGGSPLEKSIGYTDRLILSHDQNNFSLQFAALGYSSPSTYRYRYRLDALNNQWNEIAADQRFVNYSALAPGKYSFRVQASTGQGAWNAPGAIMYIEVLPPWWESWWFRILTLAVSLTLLWGFYQLRVRQLAKQFDVRLEERISERTRIARELHDTLLQSFQGLLLRFQAASNLTTPGPPKQELDTAIDQAAQAITESRNALQGLRSSTPVTGNLAASVTVLGEDLAAHQANGSFTKFRVEVEGTPRAVHPVLSDEVYRIAGEALRNAFVHAHARRVEVEIRYDRRHLRLRVRDDGKGIDSSILRQGGRSGHFGLRGMRERAKMIGARLDIWSERDSGTEVELRIPASRVYVEPPVGHGLSS
jgi:signal transduction histidine kinase/ligand-binding sensor domain-containing protein